MLININKLISEKMITGLASKFALSCTAANELNNGSTSETRMTAIINEKQHSRNDSLKNFAISWEYLAPSTFCTPVSFARLNAPAVVRLMKLKQAISNINPAMIINV